MVINPSSNTMIEQLNTLFEQMDACAQELETLTDHEYEAIRELDAELILQAGKQRLILHQYLQQLEQQTRQLLARHQISNDLNMSSIIDTYADQQSTALQSLRKNLYERFLRVDQKSQENRMRLHAAYNVSTTILQGLGLAQQEQVYHRRTAR